MRMGNYFWLVFLSLISFNAFSADYFWFSQDNYVSATSSSASGMCSLIADKASKSPPADTYTYTGNSLRAVNSVVFQCQIKFKHTSGDEYTKEYGIQRDGQSCPTGTKYNEAKGECASENPCADKAGQSVNVARSGTAPDAFATIVTNDKGKGTIATPSSSCMNSCAVTTTNMKCAFNTTGKYRCRAEAIYSGSSCGTSDSSMDAADTSSFEAPKTDKTAQNCIYTTDANGNQVCSSSKEVSTEGQKCGTFNGQQICKDSQPNSEKQKIDTTVKEEKKPDGSSTTTKTDTKTETKCDGVKSCTTTTTTTTTVTNKDKDGNGTSSTSTCTGDKCDKTNTGTSSGTGEGEGEEEGGDMEAQDWYQSGDDTYQSVFANFSDKVQQLPIKQASASFFDYNPGGACKVYNMNVWFVKANFSGFCDGTIPWDAIRAVLLASAAFFAFRIAILD